MKLARRSVLAGLAGACATRAPPVPPQTFIYDDVNRYAAAVTSIAGGAEPVAAMQAYIDAGSEGLRTWVGIYPFTAQHLADAYAEAPRYYSALAAMPERISSLEPELARAYGRMEAIAPDIDLGAIYFVVGNRVAGGTVRAIGTLVAVDMFGAAVQADASQLGPNARSFGLDELAQVVIHEGAHNLQRQVQTEQNFISIYVNPQRMTMRNFAIREGVADYVTHLVSGRRFEPRHAFAEPREAEIWAEFAPLMDEHITAQPGWFTGRFSDGRAWPIQVGYFVGFKLAEHIHRGAADPDAALIELLSPYTDEQFGSITERYAAKFA